MKTPNGLGTIYPAEVKAAVLADALTGMGERRLSAKHNIPRSTVRNWIVSSGLRRVQGAAFASQTQQSEAELFDLVIEYLRESLKTLRAVLQGAADPEWLSRQNARELAIFFGVVSDKAGWYLNALRRSAAGELESGGGMESDSEARPAPPGR